MVSNPNKHITWLSHCIYIVIVIAIFSQQKFPKHENKQNRPAGLSIERIRRTLIAEVCKCCILSHIVHHHHSILTASFPQSGNVRPLNI